MHVHLRQRLKKEAAIVIGMNTCCRPVQWDLTFCDPNLERRFEKRFSVWSGCWDMAHCAVVLLVALYCIARSVLAGSRQDSIAPLWGSCASLISYSVAEHFRARLRLALVHALQCGSPEVLHRCFSVISEEKPSLSPGAGCELLPVNHVNEAPC